MSKIYFSDSQPLISRLEFFLNENTYSKILVLVDENTHTNCYRILKNELPSHQVFEIKSGEIHKNLNTCEQIWQAMTEFEMDRKSLCINLGGGVIGDMGGFCAATYKRGIDFIQIPTTLLSMVDASVGGKLGIDFKGLKNHIGVFKEPKAVFIEPIFLQTLPENELRSGFAEIIKHCLIADKEKWKDLMNHPPKNIHFSFFNIDLIRHSIAIKSRIVSLDPEEKGLRKILNFGHTIGHAIETYLLENPIRRLLHGEAIAIGMICEGYLSVEKGFLAEEDFKNIQNFILQIYPKIELKDFEISLIAPLALQDKKNEHQKIQCTLLEGIGKAIFNQVITLTEIEESLKFYQTIA